MRGLSFSGDVPGFMRGYLTVLEGSSRSITLQVSIMPHPDNHSFLCKLLSDFTIIQHAVIGFLLTLVDCYRVLTDWLQHGIFRPYWPSWMGLILRKINNFLRIKTIHSDLAIIPRQAQHYFTIAIIFHPCPKLQETGTPQGTHLLSWPI